MGRFRGHDGRALRQVLLAMLLVVVLSPPATGQPESRAPQQEEPQVVPEDSSSSAPGTAPGGASSSPARRPPIVQSADLDYFKRQHPRTFLAAEVGAGIPSHARLSLGYGRPHYMWGGVDGNALLTPWFVAVTGGLALRLLVVNLAVNLRRVVALSRQFAPIAPTFTDADLADPSIGSSQYTSVNMQLSGFIPAGPTLGAWGLRGNYLLDLPPGAAYYNEIFRAVLSDEGAMLAQLHWLLLLCQDRVRIGPGANVVLSASRSATVRVGLGLIWSITNHLSADLVGSLPVASPDPDLAIGTRFWGLARLKWVWASGEPAPGFF